MSSMSVSAMGRKSVVLTAIVAILAIACAAFYNAPEEAQAEFRSALVQAQERFAHQFNAAQAQLSQLSESAKVRVDEFHKDTLVLIYEATTFYITNAIVNTHGGVRLCLVGFAESCQDIPTKFIAALGVVSLRLDAARENAIAYIHSERLVEFSKLTKGFLSSTAQDTLGRPSSQMLGFIALPIGFVLLFVLLSKKRRKSLMAVAVADVAIPEPVACPLAQITPAPFAAATPAPLSQGNFIRRRRTESPAARLQTDENSRPVSDNTDLLYHLNTASKDDLHLISGLGEKSVQKLLMYRSTSGDLESIDDLSSKVKLHPATFASFKRAQVAQGFLAMR